MELTEPEYAVSFIAQTPVGGGGRGTPLYEPYRYVPALRVGFCAVLV